MRDNYNKFFTKTYEEVIALENIYKAWEDFKIGKIGRYDVNEFALNLSDNLFSLYEDLKSRKYKHDKYDEFTIIEIKKRIIHKARVRDRIVHRLVYNELYKYFNKKFIFDSYSCRENKGSHKAILRYEYFFRKITKNHTKTAFVLKFDIRKCFENIDQNILLSILERYLQDKNILNLCGEIIFSFKSENTNTGLPLGNLTSQLFINIYLHEIDFYIKHKLKIKYYIRYADDFLIMHNSKTELEDIILDITNFVDFNLRLNLHKIEIKNIYKGVDFLGFVHFTKHRILRKSTKKKMFRNINEKNLQSYLGLLKWGSCRALEREINLKMD